MNKVFLIIILVNFYAYSMEEDIFDFIPEEDAVQYTLEENEYNFDQLSSIPEVIGSFQEISGNYDYSMEVEGGFSDILFDNYNESDLMLGAPLVQPSLDVHLSDVNTELERGARGPLKNKCYVCGVILDDLAAFKKHGKDHLNEGQYMCNYPKCKGIFKIFSFLNKHIYLKHTDEMPFRCNYCDKRFKQKKYLINHERLHTGEKPYECDKCEYKATQLSALQSHVTAAHTKERPYQCNICNYSTKSKYTLTDHIKTHSNKKEYKCDYRGCRRTFKQRSGLLAHKNLHLEKYKCSICNKLFDSKDGLEGHMNNHNGLKPYICSYDECEFKTTNKSNLIRHIHRDHNENREKAISKKRSHSEISKTDKESNLEKPKAKRKR